MKSTNEVIAHRAERLKEAEQAIFEAERTIMREAGAVIYNTSWYEDEVEIKALAAAVKEYSNKLRSKLLTRAMDLQRSIEEPGA